MSCCLETTSGTTGGGGGGGGPVSAWTMVGEVDFRTLTPTVFAGDGTFAVDGWNITILNYANSNANMVIDADGLSIGNPGNVSRTITTGANTGPQARVGFPQLWPDFDPQAQLFLLAEVAFNGARQTQNGQVALAGVFYDSGNPSGIVSRRIVAAGNRFQGGPSFQSCLWNATGANSSALAADDPNFLGVHFPVEASAIGYALADVRSAWPDPSELSKVAWIMDTNNVSNFAGYLWPSGEFLVGLANVTASGVVWEATFERISVWAR